MKLYTGLPEAVWHVFLKSWISHPRNMSKYSDSTIIAAWELSSLAYRLSDLCSILRGQVDVCHREIEINLHDRLLNLVHEEHIDNQKVLNLLFPSKNYLPFKHCSTQVRFLALVCCSETKVTSGNNGTTRMIPSCFKRGRALAKPELDNATLLVDINPLLAYWVEQGKNICLYGSENMAWIQQFNDIITELKGAGLQLETIYVGNSRLGEHLKRIMARTGEINLSDPLSFTKVQFFWLRSESMRRSKLRLGKTPSCDHVLAELSALLDMDDKEEGWAVIGSGCSTDTFMLQGVQVMEFLRNYPLWGDKIDKLGLSGAPRNFLDPILGS
ncbi:Sieve element occlusion, N-terminal [Sesbania bispinosa]|nr:Sieve element occlusion, N-terminal [Sesbania bispinosa]